MQKTPANQGITQMPKFNKTIQMEIQVDDIYQKFLELLPEDYKHREVLAHAVIGSAVEERTLAFIYKPMFGFTNDIDFEVGDIIRCTEKDRREKYDANMENEDGSPVLRPAPIPTGEKPNWKTRSVQIGICKVIEINLYAKNKLKVEFQTVGYGSNTEESTAQVWVNHGNCTKVSTEAEPQLKRAPESVAR